MKPNFALILSPDRISLVLRAAGGWRRVGEVSPTSDRLPSELAALQARGSALAPEGMSCKVVIPNEQVRYLSIPTADLDLSQIHSAAHDALEGATPYAMDDLAFDLTPEGNVTHIAAVARETLAEAEAFADEHGFNPVGFVAIPQENAFLGEPWFGPARAAREHIEQDGVAIVVIGDATLEPADARPSVSESAGGPSVTQTLRRADAVDSLRKDPAPSFDVSPADAAAPSAPQFTSRRRGADTPTRRTVPDMDMRQPAQVGFAETQAPLLNPAPAALELSPASRNAAQGPGSFADEAERLTTFGARAQAARKPVPGYMTAALVVGLLAVLGGVGTYASGKLPDLVAGIFGTEPPDTSELTAIDVAPPSLDAAPTSEDTRSALLDPGLSDEDAAVLNALRTPTVSQQETAAPQQTAEDFLAGYAVTGIWPLAPDVPSPPPLVDIEDLYVTGIDPIEPAFDAVALPQPEEVNRDRVIDTPNSPAAAGTTFALDARGLVVGSAEGTLSPDGVRIFSGPPPRRPQTIPVRTPAVAADAPDAVRVELAGFRPRLRPGDIVETTERATLDGLTRSELAEIRPPLRPAATQASGASLVPLDSSVAPLSAPAGEPGVAIVTLRPDVRPNNFSQIVARAQTTRAPVATPVAAPAPRTVVQPKIPSSASVAREATVRNAINLRKLNLVGVYGTPSQRRALVRLSNGRYKKVQVGDRIDGGRISAIGEGELRYQKSGRNIILKMPKG